MLSKSNRVQRKMRQRTQETHTACGIHCVHNRNVLVQQPRPTRVSSVLRNCIKICESVTNFKQDTSCQCIVRGRNPDHHRDKKCEVLTNHAGYFQPMQRSVSHAETHTTARRPIDEQFVTLFISEHPFDCSSSFLGITSKDLACGLSKGSVLTGSAVIFSSNSVPDGDPLTIITTCASHLFAFWQPLES